ncbi:MAG: HAMP domain-containing sensor histidine kinase [Halofilum sp. (in: g-proteobacteria)]|nr:HAMP domain-containing sensor histidine kinase [Halofilum sp. (in: g-proteobacteria)]
MRRWIDQAHHRHRLLGLALLALQAALMLPPDDALRNPLVLCHFALVLAWQPLFQGSDRAMSYRGGLLTVLVAAAFVLWSGWLPLAVWLLLLVGVIGGELTLPRRDQVVQWLVIVYLLVALLAGVTPPLFQFDAARESALGWMVDAAGLIPVALLFVRAGPLPGFGERFDYLRTLAITLLALVLAAGAALWTYRSGNPYPLALIQSLLFVSVTTLGVNWVWRRRASHTMFQVLWNRYLLNLGTPFEHYLVSLSGPAARGLEPGSYLDQALASMSDLDWVAGVEARGPAGPVLKGERTRHVTEAHDDTAPLLVYTQREPGPALRLHIQLLARLVQELYLSRLHEAELRNQEKVRAVHETGARLTHDIKNLLQSLHSLAAAVSASGPRQAEDALELVQRQLPHINQRLQSTLEKLRDPDQARPEASMDASEWLDALRSRYTDVEFEQHVAAGARVPHELFDTVAENLLENARYKRAAQRDLTVRVYLLAGGDRAALRICDSGERVPDELAGDLFGSAVNSRQGLGVGLYQCARLAAHLGYQLRLEHNEPGSVCFLLQGPAPAGEGADDAQAAAGGA